MRPYRVLMVLSLADGTHIHPGSLISLPEERATALMAVDAIAPILVIPPVEEVAAATELADIPSED